MTEPTQLMPPSDSLTARLREYGEQAVRPFDAAAIASGAMNGPAVRFGWRPILGGLLQRRLIWIALALLAVVALGLAVAGASRPAPGSGGSILVGGKGTILGVDPDTGAVAALGPGQQPTWSPARTQIAFFVDDGLWIMAADGSARRRLVDTTGFIAASWSPDGRRILIDASGNVADPLVPNRHFLIVPIDGSAPRDLGLAPYKDYGNGSWSPDGAQVVVPTQDGLAVLQSGDGTKPPFHYVHGAGWLPRWSLDGSTIAFSAGVSIQLVPRDGSRDRILVDRVVPCTLEWSPDGRWLAYGVSDPACGSSTDTPPGAYVVDASSGIVRRVFTSSGGDQVFAVDWSPDGQQLTLLVGAATCHGNGQGDGQGEIWIVGADGSAARRLVGAVDCGWGTSPDW
ncbi:MAG: hypothetical protein ACRDF7_09385 [Candidatus Limnocylindrales bacterium]